MHGIVQSNDSGPDGSVELVYASACADWRNNRRDMAAVVHVAVCAWRKLLATGEVGWNDGRGAIRPLMVSEPGIPCGLGGVENGAVVVDWSCAAQVIQQRLLRRCCHRRQCRA